MTTTIQERLIKEDATEDLGPRLVQSVANAWACPDPAR